MNRTPTNAPEAFDRVADYYDAWVRKALPTFDEIFRVAAELVPFPDDATFLVADLGAGTGLLSERLAAAYPRARFELFDASAEMIAKAKQRFESRASQFLFRHEDLRRFGEPRRFDLVVSSLAIHHLEHREKQGLFRSIFDSLRPGGAFINVDQVLGAAPFGDLYWDTWLNRVRSSGAPESQIEASAARRLEFDRDASLQDQITWLCEAGFAADCIYKHYFVAVFLALKPAV